MNVSVYGYRCATLRNVHGMCKMQFLFLLFYPRLCAPDKIQTVRHQKPVKSMDTKFDEKQDQNYIYCWQSKHERRERLDDASK